MELPEGYFNTRYVFTANGVEDPMSFAIGGQAEPQIDPGEIATLCWVAFKTIVLVTSPGFTSGWTFTGTSTTKTIAGEPVIGEDLTSFAGSAGSEGATCNLAMLVKKNTAAGGRKNRGRMFVPPFRVTDDDVAVNGQLGPAFVGPEQVKWTAFFDLLVSSGVPPWLLHSNLRDPVTGLEIPDSAADPTPITSFTVQSLMATQRRRMR